MKLSFLKTKQSSTMKPKILFTLCLALIGLAGHAADTTIQYSGRFTVTFSAPFKDNFDLNPDGSVTYKRTYFVDSSRNQQVTIPAELLYKFDSTYSADNYAQVGRMVIQEAKTTAMNASCYSLWLGCVGIGSLLLIGAIAISMKGMIDQDKCKKWIVIIGICTVILIIVIGIIISRLNPDLLELGKALQL